MNLYNSQLSKIELHREGQANKQKEQINMDGSMVWKKNCATKHGVDTII